jgi:hypothetical protein
MSHEWILDVLSDLREFAHSNNLPGLAEQLDDTRMMAAAEIASLNEGLAIGRIAELSRTTGHLGGSGTR